jgi:hypothetical protein
MNFALLEVVPFILEVYIYTCNFTISLKCIDMKKIRSFSEFIQKQQTLI